MIGTANDPVWLAETHYFLEKKYPWFVYYFCNFQQDYLTGGEQTKPVKTMLKVFNSRTFKTQDTSLSILDRWVFM